MLSPIIRGARVYIPGKEWEGCDPELWFAGIVETCGPKRIGIRYPESGQLSLFQRSVVETYQAEYIGAKWTESMEFIKQGLVNEYGKHAGDIFVDAFANVISGVNVYGDSILDEFAGLFNADLQRRAAADLMSAILFMDTAFLS